MDKLSELSKPVAYKFDHGVMGPGDFKYGTPQMHSTAKDENASPLYSQEYVSALIHRAEQLDSMLTESVQALKAAEQRIAELERANTSQDDHINQQQDRIESLEKKNGDFGRAFFAAEKQLATPVRLPALLQPERDAVNEMIFANGRNEAIAECSVAIRQAGFLSEASPMTIEGDE